MKIDCGETRKEKRDRLKKCHKWFAWYPVRVGSHDCRWLEYVDRQCCYSYDCVDKEYRL